MRSLLIRQGLMVARTTQAAIATRCGVKKSTVANVVAGRRRSANVEAAIARAMAVPVTRLWPRPRKRREPGA